ncbi:MAG: ketoacyl-ACP synthase III [Gemmatimonadetes bacterium]|nr:ketoacyl-ACP synthase III [Gemmatimonadota bacterium]NNM06792.1 ketoacyl-ACP synthase III [Gemmatimonadota bacterium]
MVKHPKPLVEIVGTGRYVPDRVLTNADLEKMVETNDEWIVERTGIRERRIARDDEGAAQMGAEAARKAMEEAGVEPGEVDILIVSTATPDRWLPSTACDLQALLGAGNAMAFDICAACSGWLYGLTMAEGYLAAGRGEIALVVAAEKMSSITDWEDRATCVLFGDAAGAAVLKKATGDRGILSAHHKSDGNLADLLYRPGGGAAIPMSEEVLVDKGHLVKMSGREVFKNAVRSMADASGTALEKAGLTGDDIDLLIPHQANIRIIKATAKYAGIPMEKVYINVDRFGNTSSAAIPVALDEAKEAGIVGPGTVILTAAFGAGFTWSGMTIRL